MDEWEISVLLDVQQNSLIKYENFTNEFSIQSVSLSSSNDFVPMDTNVSLSQSDYEINVIKSILGDDEISCREFIDKIDEVLFILSDLSKSYSDVTGRTNTLMSSCEDLLEQQQKIQSTLESLKEFLIPFSDIEEVSILLGIPIDSHGLQISHNTIELTIDPRSPDFQKILKKLAHCQVNLIRHNGFKDFEMYQKILDQLQNRATSLVVKGMRELFEGASKACTDLYIKNKIQAGNGASGYKIYEDQPLELSPIYQKFRGLGFRMRELTTLLLLDDLSENFENNGFTTSYGAIQEKAINDVKQMYVMVRNSLLFPFVKEFVLAGLNNFNKSNAQSKKSKENENTTPENQSQSLCHGIRQAFSSLLRIAQLEQHLYTTLFASNKESSIKDNSESQLLKSTEKISIYSSEVVNIVENVINIIIDSVRPLIIAESVVDELCRIIVTLNEDIRSQFNSIIASRNLIELLLSNLNRVIFDSQERLSYCAENELRLTVQFFEPLPSQVAYPDILEKLSDNHSEPEASITKIDDSSSNNSILPNTSASASAVTNSESVNSISRTWYPPLRNTLSLMSKLYGIVEMNVFDDFARRSVRICLQVLNKAAELVKRRNASMQIHGDLFLIRHLLLFREQLIPFEIKLQITEKSLDFKNTRSALNNLTLNSKNLVRFDNYNAILQLAREGLPGTLEKQIDARQELDNILRESCMSFKQNTLKLLLNPIISFLTKVEAFVGDIPVSNVNLIQKSTSANLDNDTTYFPSEKRNVIKNQPFVKFDRIKDVLEGSQQLCIEAIPELREYLKLYVENQFARNVLLKPVCQEIELIQKKFLSVINNCVDAGSNKRALEQLLHSVLSTSLNELNKHQ